jgi:hypothetical protein
MIGMLWSDRMTKLQDDGFVLTGSGTRQSCAQDQNSDENRGHKRPVHKFSLLWVFEFR